SVGLTVHLCLSAHGIRSELTMTSSECSGVQQTIGEGGVIVGGFCSVTDGNKTAALLKLYFLMGILCSLAFNLVYYSPALLH
ncbi:MAG: hypothetical protein AAGJ80_09120, partial [Cyanobacteria bacterium J06553_1]